MNLNAVGGVRLPDVELGVGTYLGIGPPADLSDFTTFQWLAGGFDDLSCAPLPDGSKRFDNHRDYVRQFRGATRELQRDGFITRKDARQMIRAAAQSDIGDCP